MRTESDIRNQVERELTFAPFIVRIRDDVPVQGVLPTQNPDMVISLTFDGTSRDFAAETRSVSGLKNLRLAIMQARAVAYANPPLLPMVVMPYLRPEALDELIAQKTSGIDLCGNGVVYIPNAWFAYRTGARNRYPSSAPIKSPFRGEQSIVARALLSRRTFESQQQMLELLAEFGTAASTVSKMLTALGEELMAEKKPAIRALRAAALLDALRDNYRPPAVRRTQRLRRGSDEGIWTRFTENAQRSGTLYAISAPERYAVLPNSGGLMRLLTTNAKALLQGVELVEDDRFPDLEVQETGFKSVFFGRENEGGKWWTSPLQEYLALSNGGKREQDAAAQLRSRILAVVEGA